MGEILLDKEKFEKIVQYVTITWIEQWCFLYQYGRERIWDRLRGNTECGCRNLMFLWENGEIKQ